MDFKTVARTFEKIEVVSSRLEITCLLSELLKEATSDEAAIICNLSLGLLRPPYKGTHFNFAEKNLIKVIAGIVATTPDDIEQQKRKYGDLGTVLQQWTWEITRRRSIMEVYDDLIALEQLSGTGAQEKKINKTIKLLRSVEPIAAKYIVRIILGSLRLGFSDMTIVDALSWMEAGDKSWRADIEHAYNVSADIGLIARTLKDKGIRGIKATAIAVGIPIRPALAERLPTAKAIIDKIGPCIAQPKLDGFRLQIHVDMSNKKTPVQFYSRNLHEMSHMFPDLTEACKKLKVRQFIGEGEAIVYDDETGSFLSFQETVKRKRKHGIEQAVSDYPLKVFLFDVLYCDGVSYLDKTYAQRREKLQSIVDSKNGVLQVIEERKITTAAELEIYFAESIAAGLEGLVVKRGDSVYRPGKRNFNWIKLKRQEEGHLDDTIDCVVLGYYVGHGKRAQFGIGAFLVGLYNKQKDLFQTVAKIGTGLKDDEWKDLKERCDRIKLAKRSLSVECAKELYPDVWVAPDIVCLVRADEITRSPVHYAGKTKEALGLALRFPRFMGYRSDKGARDATTVSELKTLYDLQYKK